VPRRTQSSALIDNLLRLIAFTGMTATILLAPNAIQLFDKPLQKYLNKLDDRDRKRELQKTMAYMKYKQLITEDYEHGLDLTPKAKRRLEKLSFDEIAIPIPKTWDKKWRIIFFDIPEPQKTQRDGFAAKMRQLGFKVLQRSVFVHPFASREEVARVAMHYHVRRFVSYIETTHLDNETVLMHRFKNLIK
jgi:DNA-binding transcriptional regulator PaaX